MIFTYENLYRAYLECRASKRQTMNAVNFEVDLEDNLHRLLEELKSGSYSPGRSICFVVTEPKPREIFAADFRDRIVHHLFVREVMDRAERMFIHDSYACRRGKGTHQAVRQADKFIRQLERQADAGRERQQQPRYLKADIQSFFMSIDKQILYSLALRLIDRHSRPTQWKAAMADLAGIIIFHNPQENYSRKGDPALARLILPHKSLLAGSADKGLPIGNYSSQFFANLYLNELDQFIKRRLKCRQYIRYVDDLLIFSRNQEHLRECRDKIDGFLSECLQLSLNKKKTVIQPVSRGLDYLGYYLRGGRIYPRRSVTGRYKRKLYQAATGARTMDWRKTQAIAASYAAHCRGAG